MLHLLFLLFTGFVKTHFLSEINKGLGTKNKQIHATLCHAGTEIDSLIEGVPPKPKNEIIFNKPINI